MSRVPYLLLIFIVLLVTRAPSFVYPILDEDEAVHATIAAQIVSGNQPYVDGVDGKFPFLWYQYAAMFRIFGLYNMFAVHALTLMIVGATAWLLSRIGALIKDEQTGRWAGLLYALFSTASYYKILGSNFELHMLLWECAAVLLALISLRRPNPLLWWFFSGICAGLSILTKQQGGMILFTLPIAIFLPYRPPVKSMILGIIAMGLGTGLVGSACILLAWYLGYLQEMIYWTVTYPREYIAHGAGYITSWKRSSLRIGFWLVSSLPLWIAAIQTLKRDRNGPATRFAIVWLALSWIPVSLGGRYYAHYFLLNLPGLVLLAAPSIARSWTDETSLVRRRLFTATALLPVAIFLTLNFAMPQVKNRIGEVAPDYDELGQKIAALVPKEERIFVWGWAPEFYVYSRRLSAGRFPHCDYLSGRMAGSAKEPELTSTYAERIFPGTWENLMQDFVHHPPALVIDSAAVDIHDYAPYPIAQYPQLAAYLAQGYRKTDLSGIPVYVRENKALTRGD